MTVEPDTPGPGGGRHRAPSGPPTAPLRGVGRSPAGLHQEHDLEPRRWPWAALVAVCTVLASGAGYAWGYGGGASAERAASVRVEVSPAPTVTVTSRPRQAKTTAAPRTVRRCYLVNAGDDYLGEVDCP
jgi:hypothetical protein